MEEEEGATVEEDIKTSPALGPYSRVSRTYVMICDLYSCSLLLDVFSCVALSCTVFYNALIRLRRIMSRQYVTARPLISVPSFFSSRSFFYSFQSF
jgi:hypothetical protein